MKANGTTFDHVTVFHLRPRDLAIDGGGVVGSGGCDGGSDDRDDGDDRVGIGQSERGKRVEMKTKKDPSSSSNSGGGSSERYSDLFVFTH